MGRNSKKVWVTVRRLYEKHIGTVADICAEYDITVAALYYRAGKEGWKKRGRRRCNLVAGPSTKNISKKTAKKSADAEKGERVEKGARSESAPPGLPSVGVRLYEVLELKLEEIEGRIARGDRLTPEENEREQRVIGNLIRNFDKLTEFNERRKRGTSKRGASGGRGAGGSGQDTDLSKLNAVQFREEIARRIRMFEATRKS